MTKKEYRQLIEYRVAFINKKLGTNYTTDYVSHYGGWNMYEINPENGGHYRNLLGFDCRKSNAEMLNYVDGIFELLCHYEVTKHCKKITPRMVACMINGMTAAEKDEVLRLSGIYFYN